ncbi:hypothetical protein IAR50_004317 [Cryptococcus sp. DSM 104548]
MSAPITLPRGEFVKVELFFFVVVLAKPSKTSLIVLIILIRDDILANDPGTLQFFVVEDPAEGEIIT